MRSGPPPPAHDTIRHRQGKDQRGDSRDGKGRVHHGSGADAVGQHAAVGPEDGGRNGIGRANHARCRDAEAVDTGQIAWQPKCERDEATKDEEIIKSKAPDLQIFTFALTMPTRGNPQPSETFICVRCCPWTAGVNLFRASAPTAQLPQRPISAFYCERLHQGSGTCEPGAFHCSLRL